MSKSQIYIVSIEGNIGSGKTTLMTHLKQYYKDCPFVRFVREPVDEWENFSDENGNNMLQKFYGNQSKYAFPFQIMALMTRFSIIKAEIELIQKDAELYGKKIIIITERSLQTDKDIFAKMLFEQGKMESVCFSIYMRCFDELNSLFASNACIYVATEPSLCYKRMHVRSREGEQGMPLAYLESCHKYHRKFIASQEVLLELDGNQDLIQKPLTMDNWLIQIDLFLNHLIS